LKTFQRNQATGIASLDVLGCERSRLNCLGPGHSFGTREDDWLALAWRAIRLPVDCRQVTDAFALGRRFEASDSRPRHDRDRALGRVNTRHVHAMVIRDHPTAPRSQWQSGHVERLIGSVRANLSTCHRDRRSALALRPEGLTLHITMRSGPISL